MVRMEYTGSNPGAITFERVGGENLSKKYRGGTNPSKKFANVEEVDVNLLLKSGKWKLVNSVAKQTSPEAKTDIPMPTPSKSLEAGTDSHPDNVIVAGTDSHPDNVIVAGTDSHPDNVIVASAKVRKEAKSRGLDLDTITGTGAGGRIVMADLNVD